MSDREWGRTESGRAFSTPLGAFFWIDPGTEDWVVGFTAWDC